MEKALAEKKSEAGKQKEKKPLESGAVRAVVELDSYSPMGCTSLSLQAQAVQSSSHTFPHGTRLPELLPHYNIKSVANWRLESSL